VGSDTSSRDEEAGMTEKSMLSREASRRRKFRQVGLVQVEPAIKWWKQSNYFFDFVPVVMQMYETKRDAEVGECQLVDEAKTERNMPLVARLVGKKRKVSGTASDVWRPEG